MPFPHLLLALVVVVAWGLNFIFVEFALRDLPPLLLCGIRFVLASVPVIFFIKPPAAPFKTIVLYGFLMFGCQFGFLFIGMKLGMAPGLTSLVIQVQVFFSLFFAAIFLRELPGLWQILGALVSFSGIGLVSLHVEQHASFLGLLCVLAAAISWGLGNLITKKIQHINMIALVVWGSFVACFPMLLLSWLLEGKASWLTSYHHLTWLSTISVLYIVYISTWVGYGVWNWLISRYPIAIIVPFTLLVPIVAIISSIIVFHERFELWKLFSGLLVIGGLGINLLGARFFIKNLPVMKKN